MISVILPAHNEEKVIFRALSALAGPDTELIVVANGCTDKTADAARQAAQKLAQPPEKNSLIKVIETPVGNKINALNLGDAAATGYPRFYIDADVLLSRQSLLTISAELKNNAQLLAAAPLPHFDTSHSSWAVKSFYKINSSLPSASEGIGGSGVYALSELGRRRFGMFPSLTADDGYVRVNFAPNERKTFKDCPSTVFAPKNLKELIAIKTRSHFGTVELRQKYPELWKNKGADNEGALKRMSYNPLIWPAVMVYLYVKIRARKRAAKRMRTGAHTLWERDETSRDANVVNNTSENAARP